VQVGIILAELVGEEHALVDDGAARDRYRVVTGERAFAALIDRVRDRLAQDVETALEIFLVRAVAAADKHLHAVRLGRLDRLAERRIVGRHVAPAEQLQAFRLDLVGNDALDHFTPGLLARHEQRADGILAGSRKREAGFLRLARKERVRDLYENASAIAGARIGADGATMFQIAKNADRVGDDLMRLLALDVGNEADAARIFFECGVVETFSSGTPVMLADGQAGLRRHDTIFDSVTPNL
jgi:hypothetical protein